MKNFIRVTVSKELVSLYAEAASIAETFSITNQYVTTSRGHTVGEGNVSLEITNYSYTRREFDPFWEALDDLKKATE